MPVALAQYNMNPAHSQSESHQLERLRSHRYAQKEEIEYSARLLTSLSMKGMPHAKKILAKTG